jgi:MOSC domain-containing protein YiiM
MLNVTLGSIQVALPGAYGDPGSNDPMKTQWVTGFYKKPIDGEVQVDRLGLRGDGVADTRNHGGLDKAILGYSAAHYSFWKSILGTTELNPGAFGENLTIVGQTEASVCIGDRYRIGSCELQISQPRQPCWKLGRRHENKMLPKWVTQTGFGGWYYRVLQTGSITAGETIHLLERRYPQWTVARANDVLYGRELDSTSMTELFMIPELSESWKSSLG